MSEPRREIDALLDAALDLPTSQVADFLDRECPPEQRSKVERLLAACDETPVLEPAGALSGQLWRELSSRLPKGPNLPPGEQVDLFSILRLLEQTLTRRLADSSASHSQVTAIRSELAKAKKAANDHTARQHLEAALEIYRRLDGHPPGPQGRGKK